MKATWNKSRQVLILTAETIQDAQEIEEMVSSGGSVSFRVWGYEKKGGPVTLSLRREEVFIPDDNT